MDSIDYGVSRLSLIPVRRVPEEGSEQVTQLLFGDHYEVMESDDSGQWMRILINFDQYEGWISRKQHHSVSREYYLYNNKAEFKITTDLTTSILYHKNRQIILIGSIIPISSSELFKMEEEFAFNGEAKNLGQRREFEFLLGIALRYLNAPYQWGGKSPFGIDCSGFVQMVFKICGYKLQRDSGQQAGQGKAVSSLADALPGDLAFFKSRSDFINHVGIVLDGNKIIHASGWVRIDYLTEDGILTHDTKIFTHELVQVKRIMI